MHLFGASTIMPVILYVTKVHEISTEEGRPQLAKWETPVVRSPCCDSFELVVIIGPAEFCPAQYYLLGSLVADVVLYLGQLLLDPASLRAGAGSGNTTVLK